MSEPQRKELAERLKRLEAEIAQVHSELALLDANAILASTFVLFEVCGAKCAINASSVLEITRLVKTDPLVDCPSWVMGTFRFRGEPRVAVDLGAWMTGRAAPPFEAHILVMRNSGLAFVVDAASQVIPNLTPPGPEVSIPSDLLGSSILAGLGVTGDTVVPVVALDRFLSLLSVTPAGAIAAGDVPQERR